MDKIIGAVILTLLSTWELGALEQEPLIRVTGEVVALQCYPRLGEDGRGEGHATCARHCAMAGSGLGLLTDKQLYVATGVAAALDELRELVAETVTVEGIEQAGDGELRLEIRSIEDS